MASPWSLPVLPADLVSSTGGVNCDWASHRADGGGGYGVGLHDLEVGSASLEFGADCWSRFARSRFRLVDDRTLSTWRLVCGYRASKTVGDQRTLLEDSQSSLRFWIVGDCRIDSGIWTSLWALSLCVARPIAGLARPQGVSDTRSGIRRRVPEISCQYVVLRFKGHD